MAKAKPKAPETEVKETVVETVVEQKETVVEPAVEAPKAEVKEAPKAESKSREVVRETSQQLGIFTDYIYNVKHKDAEIVVENMGFGDVYVSTEGLAKVGYQKERLLLGESMKFENVERLYFTSASQPVVQILEVK